MSEDTVSKQPLRVLHIGKYFAPHSGGMETYLRDLMRVQHRHGLHVTALAHSSKVTGLDEDIQVDALDGTAFKIRLVARWFNLGFIPVSPFFWLAAGKIIRRFRPDIIHIHHPNSSAIWLLMLPTARRIPWVAHWHSDVLTPSSSWLVKCSYCFYSIFEQGILKKSSLIFTTSHSYLEGSKALSDHVPKVKVMPLGLDTRGLPSPGELTSIPKSDTSPVILFLGRLASYKGLSYLLRAIANLSGVQCWLAGEGRERAALEKLVVALNMQKQVHFIGGISENEKWRYLKTADVVVLPSTDKNEAFGIVLLEAGYMGKQMVVTDILHSGTAWVGAQLKAEIIAARDVEALVFGIKKALKKSMLPETNTLAARNILFDLEKQTAEITLLYGLAIS